MCPHLVTLWPRDSIFTEVFSWFRVPAAQLGKEGMGQPPHRPSMTGVRDACGWKLSGAEGTKPGVDLMILPPRT